MPEQAPLHPVVRRHLDALSDGVGIMQHAIGPRPDPVHGYCSDDVARALQVDLLHQRTLGWPAIAGSASRAMDFLAEAFDRVTGRFRNFRTADGAWVDGVGSEDCHGRVLLALGEMIADGRDAGMVESATTLFGRALPAAIGSTALRAQASVLLACAAKLGSAPDPATAAAIRILGIRLLASFESRLGSSWPWPESRLTYENALPARALIVAGEALASQRMIDTGLGVLDWLIDAQVTPDGHLSPIGNGWWPCGGEKARFDQQPIEATALLLAAEAAFEVTGERRYRTAMERAYAWFLGRNDLALDVADPSRGAGYDGLTPRGVNTNQGAESTLMWLIALEHVRTLRDRPSVVPVRHEITMAASAG